MGSSNPEDFSSSDSSMISVQELVKGPTKSIPQQFVRLNQEHPSLSVTTPLPSTPTIDMSRLVSGDDHELELQKLHSTCIDWGLFQLVNHGVSSSLLEKLKHEVEEFFKLPLEEKMKYKIREGELEGYGSRIRGDGKRDWVDSINIITNPLHRRSPRLFPELPSSLRNTLESYLSELKKLATKLFVLMAKALKIDEKEMIELFDDGFQAVRMAYYPPCPKPESVMGLVPHSDISLLTILLQVNGVDGLQIRKDGLWFPLNVIPDAFVVNVGDTLEIFSNGVYHSIEHKVSTNTETERITVAFFFSPKLEADIGPSPTLINPNNPPLFRKVGMEQYLKDYFSLKPNGKAYLDHMRIPNGQHQHNSA
ncbi:codeine O-demethylase-like [Durio zibethinus]|uniref:Codeine O-demethylase-like n=1 Tax=Durio zibethinus TaxID=66656 RepID=A0A6P5WVK5_DURZI|nr:codeine O-demethylase-like [Durio zibethinus]